MWQNGVLLTIPCSNPHSSFPGWNALRTLLTLFHQFLSSFQTSFRLDSVGNGGFEHDFGSLKGDHSALMEALDSFGSIKPSFYLVMMILLGPQFPSLASRIPNEGTNGAKALSKRLKEVAGQLLTKARKDKEFNGESVDGSILRTLGQSLFPFFGFVIFTFNDQIVRSEGASTNERMESRVCVVSHPMQKSSY